MRVRLLAKITSITIKKRRGWGGETLLLRVEFWFCIITINHSISSLSSFFLYIQETRKKEEKRQEGRTPKTKLIYYYIEYRIFRTKM